MTNSMAELRHEGEKKKREKTRQNSNTQSPTGIKGDYREGAEKEKRHEQIATFQRAGKLMTRRRRERGASAHPFVLEEGKGGFLDFYQVDRKDRGRLRHGEPKVDFLALTEERQKGSNSKSGGIKRLVCWRDHVRSRLPMQRITKKRNTSVSVSKSLG